MGLPRFQASFANPTTATTFRVRQPTGVGAWVVFTLPANAIHATMDALLLWLIEQFLIAYGAGWLFTVVNGKVRITTTLGNFDWQWLTATATRDKLGYAGDVANQATPWNAAVDHWGGFYPLEEVNAGAETMGGSMAALTMAQQAISGTHDSLGHPDSLRASRELTINLQRTAAGAFDEFTAYRAFLEIVADGRRFTLWPDASDYLTTLILRWQGPERIVYRPRFPREWRYFRVLWQVEDVS